MKDLLMHYKKLSFPTKKDKPASGKLSGGFAGVCSKTCRFHRLLLCFAVFAALVVFTIMAGCDYHAPTIGELQYRLNLVNDLSSQKVYQKLSVFIMAQDQDGFEDLAKVYIIHDAQELYWTIESSSWRNSNNKTVRSLIGSNGLVMPGLANFPDGEYRVMLEDLAGDTTEKSFFLYTQQNAPAPEKAGFPVSYLKGQKIFVTSKQEQITLRLYKSEASLAPEESDTLISSLVVRNGERGISYQSLKQKVPMLPQEFTYYIYALDPLLNTGLITGPYYFTQNY